MNEKLEEKQKKTWEAPKLTVFGDAAEITTGCENGPNLCNSLVGS